MMTDDIYMFNGITLPCKVTEGAISIQRSQSVRGDSNDPTRANPVAQGDVVSIVGVTLDGYPLVELSDGSNGPIIGFVHDHPEASHDPTTNYTKAQAIAANELRYCGVETSFVDIRPVNAKAGEDISAGDYVQYGADGQSFEKSDTETNMIALSDQNSEDRVNIGIK